MANIIPSNDANALPELSVPKRRQIYEASQSMLLHGIQFGWRAQLFKAASIYNIRSLELYELEGYEWKEYLEAIDLTERSAQRYIQIASRMAEVAKKAGKSNETSTTPFHFTESMLKTVFEPFFTNGHTPTLRNLTKFAKSLSTFEAYLSGAKIEDAEAIKLLNGANKFSPAELAARNGEEIGDEISAEEIFHRDMESMAEAKGFVWNRKKQCFLTVDGEQLNDRQRAQLVTPANATRLWKKLREATASLIKQTHDLISREGESFMLYAKYIPSEAFTQSVAAERDRIKGKMEILDLMTQALLEGDFERAEILFKKGVEE